MTAGEAQPFRVRVLLSDAAQMIAAVLVLPFAILAIGAPFALLIAGLLWLARVARAAL